MMHSLNWPRVLTRALLSLDSAFSLSLSSLNPIIVISDLLFLEQHDNWAIMRCNVVPKRLKRLYPATRNNVVRKQLLSKLDPLHLSFTQICDRLDWRLGARNLWFDGDRLYWFY
jgi:hypothetical protein